MLSLKSVNFLVSKTVLATKKERVVTVTDTLSHITHVSDVITHHEAV